MGFTDKEIREMHLANLKRDIKQAKESGLLLEVEILGGNRCDEAFEINGKRMSFEDVIKDNPLPYKACTRVPCCICLYLFHPIRGKNGRLIEANYK